MNSDLINAIQELTIEKNVKEEDALFATENALLSVARDRYGNADLFVKVDRNSGDITLYNNLLVTEEPGEDKENIEISLEKAQLINPAVQLGDKVAIKLPFSPEFSRTGAQVARNLIYKKLNELRRIREYSEFSHRVGEVVSGVVKQTFSEGDVIVTIGKGLGILKSRDIPVKEKYKYKPGDQVKAYIKEVLQITEQTPKGSQYQIVLSRTDENFLGKLLTVQVPELQSGEVIIKKIVREPGIRAKVAIHSENPNLDPVKVCVGPNGNRITPVIDELKSERIDIIRWSEDLVYFAIEAIKPATSKKVIFRKSALTLIVPDDQKKKAIGEKGTNVTLASSLTGATITVLTESEAELRTKELETFFEICLDVDHDISQLLISKGFETVHDVNSSSAFDLAQATGMEEELAEAIKENAREYTLRTEEFLNNTPDLDRSLIQIPGLKTPYMQLLYKSGIKTLKELSIQESEKLKEILKEYKVTPLSIDRFISYAKRRTDTVRYHRSSDTYGPQGDRPGGFRRHDSGDNRFGSGGRDGPRDGARDGGTEGGFRGGFRSGPRDGGTEGGFRGGFRSGPRDGGTDGGFRGGFRSGPRDGGTDSGFRGGFRSGPRDWNRDTTRDSHRDGPRDATSNTAVDSPKDESRASNANEASNTSSGNSDSSNNESSGN